MIQFNTFTLPYHVGASLALILAVVLLTGVRWFQWEKENLYAGRLTLLFAAICFCLAMADNVVPAGTLAKDVPNAAEDTLFWMRLAFVFGAAAFHSLIFFSATFAGRNVSLGAKAFILSATFVLIAFIYTPGFMVKPDQAVCSTSSWGCSAPWFPITNLLFYVYITMWLLAHIASQLIIAKRDATESHEKSNVSMVSRSKLFALYAKLNTMTTAQVNAFFPKMSDHTPYTNTYSRIARLMLAIWWAGGMVDMALVLTIEYAGISIFALSAIPSGALLSVMLIYQTLSRIRQRANLARWKTHQVGKLLRAQDLQQEFLPKPNKKARIIDGFPVRTMEVGCFEVAAWNRPAEELSGDFFHWWEIRNDESLDPKLLIALADVTGHGVDASLVAISAYSYINAAIRQKQDWKRILLETNESLVKDLPLNVVMPLILVEVDPFEPRCAAINAGHSPTPIFFTSQEQGIKSSKEAQCLPLGMEAKEFSIESPERWYFQSGDMLVLATDGFAEWQTSDGKRFTPDALAREIHRICTERSCTAEQVIEHLLDVVKEKSVHSSDISDYEDDLTIIVIKCVKQNTSTNPDPSQDASDDFISG